MSDDAQRYRDNAAECERLALKSVGEATRESFRKMAAEWRRMAEDAARRETAVRKPPSSLQLDDPTESG